MFTSPMPTWGHSHDINYNGQTFPCMKVNVEESDITLYFTANGVVEWIVTSRGTYYRGRAVHNAVFQCISQPTVRRARAEMPTPLLAHAVGA